MILLSSVKMGDGEQSLTGPHKEHLCSLNRFRRHFVDLPFTWVFKLKQTHYGVFPRYRGIYIHIL